MAPLRLLSVVSVVALAVSPLASARLQPPNADASSPSRVRLVHGLHSPLWVPQQRVDGDALVSLTLALHSATPHEELDALVHAVSDVMSPQYGQFLSAEDLARHAAPSVAASTALRAFLHGREIHATESKAGDYVTLRMRVALAEQLFQTTLIQYAHESDAGVRVIRPHAAGFSVPQEIAPHVLFIDGLESLPTPQQAQFLVQDGDPFTVTKTATVSDTELLATPSVVRAQYEVPTHWNASDPNNTIVIAQFLNEYYAEHDLSQFLAQFEPSRSTVPSFPHHTGDCLAHGATRATGEASLDVQVVVALSHSDDIEMLCFQSLRDPTRAFADDNQEPFLAFLQAVNAMAPRPAVVSISYTDEECAVPEGYREAVNRELMKAALQGISILISAGDGGAQGSSMSAFCGVVPCSQFVAMFPASSPYVTAVGATTLNPATRQPNGKYGERVTSAAHGDLITSGGGFSNVFAMPAYQKKAAATYLAYADAHNLTGLFNPAGRAYPDVAALGHSFPTVQNGQVWRTDGTSVSAPIVASLVALLNRQRLATGRPVLGFLNPLLYQLYDVCPHVFTDITDGDLACAARGVACCAAGHAAIPGWDAASGVGTLRLETLATELDGCIEQIRSTSLLAEDSQPVSLLQRDMTRVLAIERIGLVVTLVAAVALVSVLVSMRGNVFPGRRFFEFQRNEPARERLLAGNHN